MREMQVREATGQGGRGIATCFQGSLLEVYTQYCLSVHIYAFFTGRTAVKPRWQSRGQRQRWQWGDLLGGEWTGRMGRRSSSSMTPTLPAAIVSSSNVSINRFRLILGYLSPRVSCDVVGVNCSVVLEDGAVFTGVASDRVS